MGYSINDGRRGTTPRQANLNPHIPPAMQMPPAPGVSAEMIQVLALASAAHGPEATNHLVRYSLHLKKAVDLAVDLERQGAEAGADPEAPGVEWYAWQDQIRAAADHYRTAAESMQDLAGTTACTTSLLATLPAALLARIIINGLECEADGLLNLLECVSGPPPETDPTKAL